MPQLKSIRGLEILDSRGRPTVKAWIELAEGISASASVPSGASTGAAEACELRDGDERRFDGLGCLAAVRHINTTLRTELTGQVFRNQQEFDTLLIELDGTPDKSKLGANALLAASLAFCRAQARESGIPLYEQFRSHFPAAGVNASGTIPRPTVNLFSGGKHAGQQVPLQDVLLVPAAAESIAEAMHMAYVIYQRAAKLTYEKYGMRALTADEGGLAPPFPNGEAMLEDAVHAIENAGYRPGEDVHLAIDVASSHFYHDGHYFPGQRPLESPAMIGLLIDWLNRFPIVSIEDGLDEEDWEFWPALKEEVRGRALVLGDDLLCTSPARIRRAVESNAADALLLKVNQIGTLSEALDACTIAKRAGWHVTASARSGETEDNWLADLAVGWNADQIKVGSITQSERLAKYNRLLEIEAGASLPMVRWPRAASTVQNNPRMNPVPEAGR